MGLKHSALMMSPPSRVYRCLPSFRSHSMAWPSWGAAKRNHSKPSNPWLRSSCPSKTFRHGNSSRFVSEMWVSCHGIIRGTALSCEDTRIGCSSACLPPGCTLPPEAHREPSGETVTVFRYPVWPMWFVFSLQLAKFQTLTRVQRWQGQKYGGENNQPSPDHCSNPPQDVAQTPKEPLLSPSPTCPSHRRQ